MNEALTTVLNIYNAVLTTLNRRVGALEQAQEARLVVDPNYFARLEQAVRSPFKPGDKVSHMDKRIGREGPAVVIPQPMGEQTKGEKGPFTWIMFPSGRIFGAYAYNLVRV